MHSVPVVGVVTAMWRRHELTDIVFENLAAQRDALKDILDLRLVAAGSEGSESRVVAERHGFAYVEVPNAPLGAKWNAALGLLRGQDIEGVCIVGSDDLLNGAYFRMVAASLAKGEKLFGLDSFYVLDRYNGRLFHWMGYPPPRDREAIGLGRFIHREYIEGLDWTLWEPDIEGGLDSSARKRIECYAEKNGLPGTFLFKSVEELGIAPVDVKHEQQMWLYDVTAITGRHITIIGDSRNFLRNYYADDVLDKIFALCSPGIAPTPQNYYMPPWNAPQKCRTAPNAQVFLAQSVICGEATEIFLPFSQRYNITFLPSDSAEIEDIFRMAQCFMDRRVPEGVRLFVYSAHLAHRVTSDVGVCGYTLGNVHTFRNIFRIYIAASSFATAAITKSLLQHGCVVICFRDMQSFYPDIAQTKAIVVDSHEEALTVALELHERWDG